MLVAFILGAIFDYEVISYLLLIVPIVFIIKFSFMPNTPQHWIRVGKLEVSIGGAGFEYDQ